MERNGPLQIKDLEAEATTAAADPLFSLVKSNSVVETEQAATALQAQIDQRRSAP